MYQRLGLRSSVERFSRYLKERKAIFYHKLSAKNHIQGIKNLKLFLNPYTIYYQTIRMEDDEMLIRTLSFYRVKRL